MSGVLVRPAARVSALPSSLFVDLDAAVAQARSAGADVIDASKGNPDLPTPAHIVRAMQEAVSDPRNHGYPSFAARPALAEAVVRRYRDDHGVELDPATQLAVFHGSHEALMAAILALCDPGDALVVPDPGYPAYRSAAVLAGARVHEVPLPAERGHQPDFGALAPLATASALLLNYPHNPTGALATTATLEAAVAESTRLGGVFVHDFAYSSLGYAGRRPLSALAVDTARTVEVSTLSKTYNMAGWRLGYAAGSREAIAAMVRYQTHAFSTVFGATQEAAAAALAGDQQTAHDLVDLYRRRRDLVTDGLRAQGWEVAAGEGTFFVWVAVDEDDVAFADRLLHEHAVAVAPGSGFGARGSGHVRIGLVYPIERLALLVDRFAAMRPPRTS